MTKLLSKSFKLEYSTFIDAPWNVLLLNSESDLFRSNKAAIEEDLKTSEAFSREQLGFKVHFEVSGFSEISAVRRRREIGAQTSAQIVLTGVAQFSDKQNLQDRLVTAAQKATDASEILTGQILGASLDIVEPFEV